MSITRRQCGYIINGNWQLHYTEHTPEPGQTGLPSTKKGILTYEYNHKIIVDIFFLC